MHAFLLSVFLAVGPNGYWVERPLRIADQEGVLPAAALADTAARLWVVYHHQPDLAMAFYEPVTPDSPPPADAAEDGSPTAAPNALQSKLARQMLASMGGFERMLPALELPRLYLYAPYYQKAQLKEMPLDVSEYLFSALLEATFDLGGEDLPLILRERGRKVMSEAPDGQRLNAYLAAMTDFGAQVMSVALELQRTMQRLGAQGKDHCPAVDHPATLFGQWGRLFSGAEFRGRYIDEGRQAFLTQSLAGGDKELFLKAILQADWSGEIRADFETGCP